jgi:large subunit ribosomal protein L31
VAKTINVINCLLKYNFSLNFAPYFTHGQNSCIKKGNQKMKKDIHPQAYRLVIFKDMSNDYSFLTRSTAATRETAVWEDGNEYPVVKVEISHMSHPFYTGKSMFIDTAGRIDKFKKRYEKKAK